MEVLSLKNPFRVTVKRLCHCSVFKGAVSLFLSLSVCSRGNGVDLEMKGKRVVKGIKIIATNQSANELRGTLLWWWTIWYTCICQLIIPFIFQFLTTQYFPVFQNFKHSPFFYIKRIAQKFSNMYWNNREIKPRVYAELEIQI